MFEILNVDVVQTYSLTESAFVTVTLPPKQYRLPNKEGSIGLARPGLVKIVPFDADVQIGPNIQGEIWLQNNAMIGYLNDPVATSETLTDDGWIKTGDIGYYDEDGYYYVVDRIKDVIKSVKNVSPTEIEEVLLSHPLVRDAAVIGVPDEECGETPMAVVIRENDQLTKEELYKLVSEHLSIYKHLDKGGIKFVEFIPRTTTGKIMHKEVKRLYA